MSYVFSATSHRLDVAAAPVSAYDFWMLLWVKLTADENFERFLMQIGVSGSGNNYHAVLLNSSDLVSARTRDGSGNDSASTTALTDTTSWHFILTQFVAANDRRVSLDSGGAATNTSSRTATGLNAMRFGRDLAAGSNAGSMRLGQAAIGTGTLSAPAIASLAAGSNPGIAAGVVSYWPMILNANDVVGTNHLTVTGAALDGDNPTVDAYPSTNWTQYRRRQNTLICM